MPKGIIAQADDWIHLLTPHEGVDAPEIIEWLNTDFGQDSLRRIAKGVGTLSLSKSSLAQLVLPGSLNQIA
jgi:hypothetical protein